MGTIRDDLKAAMKTTIMITLLNIVIFVVVITTIIIIIITPHDEDVNCISQLLVVVIEINHKITLYQQHYHSDDYYGDVATYQLFAAIAILADIDLTLTIPMIILLFDTVIATIRAIIAQETLMVIEVLNNKESCVMAVTLIGIMMVILLEKY